MAVFDEWVSKLVFLFVGDLLNVTYSFVTARNALKSQVVKYMFILSQAPFYFTIFICITISCCFESVLIGCDVFVVEGLV